TSSSLTLNLGSFTAITPTVAADGEDPSRDQEISGRERSRHPKTDRVGPDVGVGRAARSRPQELRRPTPGTAAKFPAVAVRRDPRLAVGGSTGVGGVVTVLQPLEHIAVHLIEAPRIGCKAVNGNRLSPKFSLRSAIVRAAVVIGLVRRDRCAPPERRG